MAFQNDDLVRIIHQPANQHVDLKGKVGLVEIDAGPKEFVYVHCMDKDGRTTGQGSVPLDCLERCDDDEWVEAKRKCLETRKAYEGTVYKWNSDLLDAKIRVAEKVGVPVDVVIQVLDAWDKEEPQNPYDR
jgi:hypothetical protein